MIPEPETTVYHVQLNSYVASTFRTAGSSKGATALWLARAVIGFFGTPGPEITGSMLTWVLMMFVLFLTAPSIIQATRLRTFPKF